LQILSIFFDKFLQKTRSFCKKSRLGPEKCKKSAIDRGIGCKKIENEREKSKKQKF